MEWILTHTQQDYLILMNFQKNILKNQKKIQQKRFQVISESMQMKSVSKVQFGRLNDKRFCFSNGIISHLQET